MSFSHRSTSAVFPVMALAALLACGCSARAPKDANPVVGPAPSRTSLANTAESTTESELLANRDRPQPADFRQVDYDRQPQAMTFDDAETIAYVNGEPILAGEVLEPYAAQFESIRDKTPPEQFRELRKQVLQRDLPIHVDNRILIQAFESTLSGEQRKMLDSAMDNLFADQLEQMKQGFGVVGDRELDMELQKRHTSLAAVKSSFANKVMAQEFLKSKLPTIPEPSRADLIRYYNEHLDDYAIRAKVRWELIEISYGKHGGKQPAMQVLSQAADELLNGVEFAEVARKYSDGPAADQGGFWDWTEEGSLKDKTLERALFTEPVGQISDAFAGDASFQVIRIIERQPAGYVPFEQLQDKIKEKLQTVQRKEVGEQILTGLRNDASVQTIFDGMPVAGGAAGDPFQPLTAQPRSGGAEPQRQSRAQPFPFN